MRTYFGVTAVILSLAAGSALAASPTKIDVSLLGEGGGEMQVKLSQATVKAGNVEFDVVNKAMTESHELVLVRLKSADQDIPVVKDKHRVDEHKLKSLGEVPDLRPGDHGKLAVMLKPGSYSLLCNVKGHYEAGMHTVLTVTK